MAEAKAKNEFTGSMMRLALWIFFLIFVIFLIGGAVKHFSGGTTSSEKSSTYELVTTISCTPDEKLWDKSGGWCMSEELPAGTYKLELEESNIQIAIWDRAHSKITGSLSIPQQGMSLHSWSGQRFEKVFLAQAPVPEMRLVAAPIARVNYEKAFDPRGKDLSLKEGSRIGISINIIPTPGNFKGNRGKITMQILRETS